MMNFLMCILTAFLCAFGFICLLYCLADMVCYDKAQPIIFLIPVNASTKDLEFRIASALSQMRHLRAGGENQIIILDNGMNDTTKAIAYKQACLHKNILIVTADELQKMT